MAPKLSLPPPPPPPLPKKVGVANSKRINYAPTSPRPLPSLSSPPPSSPPPSPPVSKSTVAAGVAAGVAANSAARAEAARSSTLSSPRKALPPPPPSASPAGPTAAIETTSTEIPEATTAATEIPQATAAATKIPEATEATTETAAIPTPPPGPPTSPRRAKITAAIPNGEPKVDATPLVPPSPIVSSPSTAISSLVPAPGALPPSPSAPQVLITVAPAPEPTLSKDEYVEVPFKKDPWSFYRSLMRGYLIYSDPESDPDTKDVSKTSRVGRILHVGTTNDIRNMFNVFTFDDIVITECDMLFGMLSRISTWATEKLKAEIPSVENVESGGDYYMEQLKDFFQQKDSHAGTDSIDFLNKLIAIDLKLPIRGGGGGRTITRNRNHKNNNNNNNIKASSSSRATRKIHIQNGGIITGIKTRYDVWKNKGAPEPKIWNDKVRQYIRKSSTDPIGEGDRSETFMTQIKKINVVPAEDDDDDKDDKDKDKDKDKKAGDDGLAKEMSTMTIEDYFKKIAVPVKRINTNVSTSYSEIVPEVWGHPLLMLIPFAKAMQCDIALYGKEKDGDGSFKLRAHIKHKADDEMTTVFKMNPTEFTIRVLDNNTDAEAYHKNVPEYMSNFALIVPKTQYTNSGNGLIEKESEINKEEIAKKKLVEKDKDTKKRTSDTAELKEINAQLESINNDLFNLMKTHPAYATLDKSIKDNVSRILDGYNPETKAKTRTSGTVPVSAGLGVSASAGIEDESSAKPKEDSNNNTVWWTSSSSSYETVIQSAKDLKQNIKNKIRKNISKPRLIIRLKDLIAKHATLSAKKNQLTLEPTRAADV